MNPSELLALHQVHVVHSRPHGASEKVRSTIELYTNQLHLQIHGEDQQLPSREDLLRITTLPVESNPAR